MEELPIKHHSNKDVDNAIKYGIEKGWRFVKKGNGHTVGYLYCTNEADGTHNDIECYISVFGSPKSPTNHAKKIKKAIDGHSC